MDKRIFWASKSPLPEFHTVTFTHPSFEAPFRLVANQFAEVTLGGHLHTPAGMTIRPPEQRSDAAPRLTLSFPRQVVGREFKRQMRRVYAAGSREPISVTYAVYLGVTDAPQLTWQLYVAEQGGIQFTPDVVQVIATDDNPMRRNVALIYDPSVFTGLSIV